MSGFHDNVLLGASGSQGYQISRSVRLRSSASAYFNRTLTTPTNGKIWTWSAWAKLGAIGTREVLFSGASSTNVNYISIDNFTTANANFGLTYANSGTVVNVASANLLRDPSSWYHLIVVYDSTSATSTITGSSTDRVRLYINGVQVTSFSATTAPALNATLYINAANSHAIGRREGVNDQYFDGYLTEINFIDGQALTPSSFGETNPVTGVWQPKKYTGTYGNNGFYLNFSDNSAATAAAIGKDYSGNGNNWTPNNISVTAGVTYDSMLDVPTQWADGGNGRGNYATWNPLGRLTSANTNGQRWEDGNLKLYPSSSEGAVNTTSLATIAIPASGKWYWEVTPTIVATAASSRTAIGIMSRASSFASGLDFYYSTVAGAYAYAANGQKINSPTPTFAAYGASYTANDVVGVAVDADAGTLTFYKNGTSQGTAFSGLDMTNEFFPAAGYWGTFHVNFGQRPFSYTPPSGFKALNTLNLPTPTILKGNQYFDATTYTGNASTNTIVNAGGFQPDLVWLKSRSAANNHTIFDSVRGANNILYPNLTNAAAAVSQYLNSFNSNGFTLGANENSNDSVGESSVGWQWKEGATQGFDIVTYTGTGANRTVAHNLGVAPAMLIFKPRNAVDNWPVWHKSFAVNEYVYLNLTNAKASLSTFMNSTLPNSSDITLGTWANTNANTQTMVCYAFAEVAGFSRFGSYTGNGSSDGVFVHLGFRARYLLIKETGNANSWEVYDTARNSANVQTQRLFPNDSLAEATTDPSLDILSNGFKCRAGNTGINRSGGTYIYAAFAENPFKNALAR